MHARRLPTTALATAAATGAALAFLPAGAAADVDTRTDSQPTSVDTGYAQQVPLYASLGLGQVPVLEQCNSKGECTPTYVVDPQPVGTVHPTTYGIGIVLDKAAGSGVAVATPTCATGMTGAGFDVAGTSTPTTGEIYVYRVVNQVREVLHRQPFETSEREGGTGYYLCVR